MSRTITAPTRSETIALAEKLGWTVDADGPIVWATTARKRVTVFFPTTDPWEAPAERVRLSHRGTDGQWAPDVELADPEVVWALRNVFDGVYCTRCGEVASAPATDWLRAQGLTELTADNKWQFYWERGDRTPEDYGDAPIPGDWAAFGSWNHSGLCDACAAK